MTTSGRLIPAFFSPTSSSISLYRNGCSVARYWELVSLLGRLAAVGRSRLSEKIDLAAAASFRAHVYRSKSLLIKAARWIGAL
jgi:hypothetical protein